jgi:hypothetical protein
MAARILRSQFFEKPRIQEFEESGAAGKRQKAKGKRQKLFVFCSIDDRHENRD